MEYFKQAKKELNPYKVSLVYSTVQSLKHYAIAIYKGNYEDALDKSFHHILENYDWERGSDLMHYALRVIKTIGLAKNRNEVESDLSLQIALDEESFDTRFSSVEDSIFLGDGTLSNDVEECMDYLVPMFIKDYKFFTTNSSRSQTYTGLFEKYSIGTIAQAKENLVKGYSTNMEYLLNLRKECSLRCFPSDRYLSDLDSTIRYLSLFKDYIIYERLSGRNTKKFYLIDLKSIIDTLIGSLTPSKSTEIRGIRVYLTLSGKIVCGDELVNILRDEIVGSVFAKNQGIKVVHYDLDKLSLVVSSSKSLSSGIDIGVLKLPTKLLIGRCVN